MKRSLGGSLFSRVLMLALAVLVACTVTFVGLGALTIMPEIAHRRGAVGRLVASYVCSQIPETGAFAPPTEIATVYDLKGRLLGSSVQPPLPPLTEQRAAALRDRGDGAASDADLPYAFWCPHAPVAAYVQLRPPPAPVMQMLIAPTVGIVLVIGLACLWFARSIARPLATLSGATEAFGRGDLFARVALPRSDEVGEVGELAHAFNQMADRLQRVILAEHELLANVSHELRTPLARMRVVLETVEEDPQLAAAMQHEIARDLGDLERLVDTVTETMRLSMASAEPSAQRLAARRRATDLRACVAAAAQRFRALHPNRTLTLSLPEGPLPADLDERLIQRLLDNLLDNARKYSVAPAAILLHARSEAAKEAAQVVVEVADRGIGIDEADLPHVLEPFFRSEHGRAHGVGGSGLGLALVKRIVGAHDGELAISSRLGLGTTVRVVLPRSA